MHLFIHLLFNWHPPENGLPTSLAHSIKTGYTHVDPFVAYILKIRQKKCKCNIISLFFFLPFFNTVYGWVDLGISLNGTNKIFCSCFLVRFTVGALLCVFVFVFTSHVYWKWYFKYLGLIFVILGTKYALLKVIIRLSKTVISLA